MFSKNLHVKPNPLCDGTGWAWWEGDQVIRMEPSSFSALLFCEKTLSVNQEGPLLETTYTCTLTLDFQPPELGKMNVY